MKEQEQLATDALRFLSIDAVEKAKSGHPGMPMGMADLACVLWNSVLRHNPSNPSWLNRDRFVLSNGHGSALLYSLLHLAGYDLPLEQLKNFRQLGSLTPGHPEAGLTPGVEVTTGPLGQGIANAVGMAIAEQALAARFNRPGHQVIDHNTWVFCGDGCLMEGISHEAISLAGHLRLSKLIMVFDDNRITIDGAINISNSDDVSQRFQACRWETLRIDGHNRDEIRKAFAKALNNESGKPILIVARTEIGHGSPNKANTAAAHGSPLGADEVKLCREVNRWNHEPFDVPPHALEFWSKIKPRGQKLEEDWLNSLNKYRSEYPAEGEQLRAIVDGIPNQDWQATLSEFCAGLSLDDAPQATRVASGKILAALHDACPGLMGGSADLTPSNNTRTPQHTDFSDEQRGGRYLRYGIREHGMAAVMNGMARHGGIIPYGGTFLTFSDYMRPSIRLSAMMELQVIYIFTHDSIGLGEDGPTHQPIEHIPALRAIPGLYVLRPCDTLETAGCWKFALGKLNNPSAILLSRQNLPPLPNTSADKVSKGAYVLIEAESTPKVLLLASGSEVQLAVESHALLAQKGIAAQVVSMPCQELFREQSQDYKDSVILPEVKTRIAIEAAIGQGWHEFIGSKGSFIGMSGFGASAPYTDLYEHFQINAQRIVSTVEQALASNDV